MDSILIILILLMGLFLYSTDIDDHRLQTAKSMGADHVFKVTHKDHRGLADEIISTLGTRPDVSLECSGSDDSFNTAIYVSTQCTTCYCTEIYALSLCH